MRELKEKKMRIQNMEKELEKGVRDQYKETEQLENERMLYVT